MFSIIMSVWNRANLVAGSIDSVLAQTFKDYELLIIDNSSDKGLEQIVTPYLSEKVKYYRIGCNGFAAARNAGLQKAEKPFIAHIDSGNIWYPEFLMHMHDALCGHEPACEAAYCITNLCRRDKTTGKILKRNTMGEPFSFRKLMKRNYIDINSFVHSRKILEFVGQFDENLKRQADWDMIIRITSMVRPVFVEKALLDKYAGSHNGKLLDTSGLKLPWRTVGMKHIEFKEPIVFVHDAIEYIWENLPEEKYYNWVRLHHWHLNTSDYTAWGYPFMLQIEPTNICNLECTLCPAGQKRLGRKLQHMPFSTFKSIIDDMEPYLMILILWDWGEPFLNPELPAMIRYASERGIKTVTSTNAQTFDNDAYLEAILLSGLSTLIVAIDSVCEHNYEAYRKKGSLNKVISGLNKVIAMKKRLESKTLINARMVIMKSNEHELLRLRRFARKIGADWFSVKTAHIGYDDPTPDSEVVASDPKYRYYAYKPGTYERIRVDDKCRKCWEMASIFSNGDIVPCCYDFNGTLKQGNVLEQPLTELWDGPIYREFRRKVYHQKHSMLQCCRCESNYALSETGWFSESHPTNYLKRFQRCFRKPFGRRMLLTTKEKYHKIRSALG